MHYGYNKNNLINKIGKIEEMAKDLAMAAKVDLTQCQIKQNYVLTDIVNLL